MKGDPLAIPVEPAASGAMSDRCACPPGECHGVGKGPDNCAAVADRQRPINELRYLRRCEAALRLLMAAQNEASYANARRIAEVLLSSRDRLSERC